MIPAPLLVNTGGRWWGVITSIKIMKINTRNYAKLNRSLDKVNGRADAHTFIGPQLSNIGRQIISHLGQWFTLADMKGMTGTASSGDEMPRAYKYLRRCNTVSWVIGARGNVFITDISLEERWREKGRVHFDFSEAQKATIAKKAVEGSSSF